MRARAGKGVTIALGGKVLRDFLDGGGVQFTVAREGVPTLRKLSEMDFEFGQKNLSNSCFTARRRFFEGLYLVVLSPGKLFATHGEKYLPFEVDELDFAERIDIGKMEDEPRRKYPFCSAKGLRSPTEATHPLGRSILLKLLPAGGEAVHLRGGRLERTGEVPMQESFFVPCVQEARFVPR